MRIVAWVTAAMAISVALFAQQRVTTSASPTGFGRILFPGGTSPTGAGGKGNVSPFGRVMFPGGTAPSGVGSPQNAGRTVFPSGGAPAAIRPGSQGPGLLGKRPPVTHGSHSASILIPIPVYLDGYYGYDAPIAQYAPTATYPQANSNLPYGTAVDDGSQASPVVIINQYFKPDGTVDTQPYGPSDYQPPEYRTSVPQVQQTPQRVPVEFAPPPPAQPEGPVFLIAMKDHNVFAANAYWIENGVLSYVTLHGDVNSASMELVDRELSKRLNKDRSVGFGLPEN